MNRGVPPTALKARTGLLTPPGMTCRARSKSFADRGVFLKSMRSPVPIAPRRAATCPPYHAPVGTGMGREHGSIAADLLDRRDPPRRASLMRAARQPRLRLGCAPLVTGARRSDTNRGD